jgi:hypothetical protein
MIHWVCPFILGFSASLWFRLAPGGLKLFRKKLQLSGPYALRRCGSVPLVFRSRRAVSSSEKKLQLSTQLCALHRRAAASQLCALHRCAASKLKVSLGWSWSKLLGTYCMIPQSERPLTLFARARRSLVLLSNFRKTSQLCNSTNVQLHRCAASQMCSFKIEVKLPSRSTVIDYVRHDRFWRSAPRRHRAFLCLKSC